MSYQIKRAADLDQHLLHKSITNLIAKSYGHLHNYELIKEFLETENIEAQISKSPADTYILFYDAKVSGLCTWKNNVIEYFLFDFSDYCQETARYFLSKMIESKSQKYCEIKLECLQDHKMANELFDSYGFILQTTCCDDFGCFNTWKLFTKLN